MTFPNCLTAMLPAIAILVAQPVDAKDRIDPAMYPELSQEALLPVIVNRLRHDLSDPYSVRDMVMCPPRAIRLVDGRPDGWVVQLRFNTRNLAGGYTGIKNYGARFRHGRISAPIAVEGFADDTGLNSIVNRAIDRLAAGCPAVPDAAVQTLLQARQ